MVTIKAYTDLPQSKKLAKILSLEKADMYYREWKRNTDDIRVAYVGTADKEDLPCWSLTALLSVLPFHLIVNNQRYAFSMHKGLDKNGETYMIRYNVFNTDVCLCATDYYSSPIDACVDMIENLHKLKML